MVVYPHRQTTAAQAGAYVNAHRVDTSGKHYLREYAAPAHRCPGCSGSSGWAFRSRLRRHAVMKWQALSTAQADRQRRGYSRATARTAGPFALSVPSPRGTAPVPGYGGRVARHAEPASGIQPSERIEAELSAFRRSASPDAVGYSGPHARGQGPVGDISRCVEDQIPRLPDFAGFWSAYQTLTTMSAEISRCHDKRGH